MLGPQTLCGYQPDTLRFHSSLRVYDPSLPYHGVLSPKTDPGEAGIVTVTPIKRRPRKASGVSVSQGQHAWNSFPRRFAFPGRTEAPAGRNANSAQFPGLKLHLESILIKCSDRFRCWEDGDFSKGIKMTQVVKIS